MRARRGNNLQRRIRTGAAPSLIDRARMERELSALLGGRKVDLRTPRELSRYFREPVFSPCPSGN